jgi:hypothetical protein
MLCLRSLVLIAVCLGDCAAASAAAVTCRSFLEMPTAERATFVNGLRDGFGATLGIFQSFSTKVQASISDIGEARGVETLNQRFLDFLNGGRAPDEGDLLKRIAARCEVRPDQVAATSFFDVILSLDRR